VLRYHVIVALLFATACHEGPPVGDPPAPESPVLASVKSALPAWRFLKVEGDVLIDGKPAAKNTKIGPTSTIEAATGGYALITLGKKSIIEVREKTEMTLGTSERKKTSVQLLAGELWSLFGGKADYEVVTSNAVAGVRGTVFYVNAANPKSTIVCACTHAVHLESLDPKKPSEDDITATEWEHIGTSFNRRGKRVRTKSLGSYPNPPNHPDTRGKELLALMPD